MPQPYAPSAAARAVVTRLAEPQPVRALHPVAGRFVYALRLVALHERARTDPVPELTQRLGQITIAIKTLQLLESVSQAWPERVSVRRFCCGCLSHDELTLGRMVEAAWRGDEVEFGKQLHGLVRPDRIERIWFHAVDLVMAEAQFV